MKTKIGLVTGGSKGIGKNIAICLAKDEIDIVLTFKSDEKGANETAEEIRSLGRKAICMKLDMTIFKNIHPFIDELKLTLNKEWGVNNLDFLVNNAGMGTTVPIEKVTEEIFDNFLNVHFKGVYFLTQGILEFMNAGGRIINISTGTTRFSNPGYSVYASMKGAIEIYTKYIAKEFGKNGIGANIVAPGPVETDFNNAAIRSNPQFKSMLGSITSLGRVGVPEDIGGVVAFLCSEKGAWINGQRIEVSGGINV